MASVAEVPDKPNDLPRVKPWERRELSPVEFQKITGALERKFPNLRYSSGDRGVEHNKQIKGAEESKHLIKMAGDWVGPEADMRRAMEYAISIGAYAVVHDVGSGLHLHTQGMKPKTPVSDEWREKHWQGQPLPWESDLSKKLWGRELQKTTQLPEPVPKSKVLPGPTIK